MKSTDPKYMICWLAKRYCNEDISLIENYETMIADYTQKWCCHHRREIDENKSASQLIAENLYYNRPPSELIFMTKSEHSALHAKLHMKGKPKSEATKKKMSDAMKGNQNAVGERSEATKKKISEAKKGNKYALGMHWWNNGVKQVYCKECPEGYGPGRLKRNKPDSYESGLPAAE